MSRYDYPDPGQDAEYCDGLAPEPDELDFCIWCNARLWTPEHYPYCSALCGVMAVNDDRED